MNHSTYQAMLPYYRNPFGGRALNPVAIANPEWMAAWWDRRDALQARVDEYYAKGQYARATAFLQANDTVPITEESVKVPVPALVEPVPREQFEEQEF